MPSPKTPPSVYVVQIASDIVKVGYSAQRRWRDLERRNNGTVIGVWHFATGAKALAVEAATHRVAQLHGTSTDPDRLVDRGGYRECVTTDDAESLIGEVVGYLESQGEGVRCPDPHWCGTHLIPCLEHHAKHKPSIAQAMHVRTDERTNEESGPADIKLTTVSRARRGEK